MKRTIRTKEQLIQDVRDLEAVQSALPFKGGSMTDVIASLPYKYATAIHFLKKQLLRQYGYRFPGDNYDYPDLPLDPKDMRGPIED